MLVHKGRLETGPNLETWMREASSIHKLNILALTPEVAVKAYQLPDFHGNPADRVIAATAIVYDIPLITKDRRLQSYPLLQTLR